MKTVNKFQYDTGNYMRYSGNEKQDPESDPMPLHSTKQVYKTPFMANYNTLSVSSTELSNVKTTRGKAVDFI